jgi:uncharacterized damage-inducible protein DinB
MAEFETQRERVPLDDSGELDTATAFLSFARHCLVKKLDGLDEEQVRRVMVDSGTSLLGLVQHMTDGERVWFGHHMRGDPDPDVDFGMAVPAGRSTADVVADYQAAIANSDVVIARLGDPEAPMAVPIDGKRLSLRWVITHMMTETTRHAGHADIIREQIDGATGR